MNELLSMISTFYLLHFNYLLVDRACLQGSFNMSVSQLVFCRFIFMRLRWRPFRLYCKRCQCVAIVLSFINRWECCLFEIQDSNQFGKSWKRMSMHAIHAIDCFQSNQKAFSTKRFIWIRRIYTTFVSMERRTSQQTQNTIFSSALFFLYSIERHH